MSSSNFFQINPLTIMLFNMIIPLSYMFKVSQFNQIMFMLYACLVLLLNRKYIRMMKFLIAFVIFHLVFLLPADSFLYGFLSSWAIIMIGFSPCLMMASVLAFDYTSAQILSALNLLRLPKSLIIGITITLRYIPTFRNEFKFIKESLRLRGIPYSWKKPLQSFEYFIAPQLFRCLILADEITASGLVKGINAPIRRSSYYDIRFRAFDVFLCLLFILSAIGGVLWLG